MSVLATSEGDLYRDENHFFSEKNPPLWAPSLVVSGFSDFDKDKQLEVILSSFRQVAIASETQGDTRSIPVTLRQSFLYVWDKTPLSALTWREAYRTVEHEERFEFVDPSKVKVVRLGE